MKLKVAFIGCGNWAKETYLPYILSNKNVSVAAISSILPHNVGEKLARQYGIKYYPKWEEMLDSETLDLVIITTPHAFHYGQIKACLERSMHIHVDKPPALRFREINTLIKLSKEKNKKVSVHVQRRYYPEYHYMRNAIKKNLLGKIEYVDASFGQQLFDDFKGSWRSIPDLAGGGIMVDTGYHLVDLVMYLIGPTRVSSVVMFGNRGGHRSDRYSTLSVQLSNETLVNIHAIRGLPKNHAIESVKVVGTKGYICMTREKKDGAKHSLLEHYGINGKKLPISNKFVENEKILPLETCINNIILNKNDPSSLDDSAMSVKIMEAGYKSMLSNRIINF